MRVLRRRSLWVLTHTLNPVAVRLARSGHGPFSLVVHVGRRTGKRYETPVVLAAVPAGYVTELTYGPEVSWYRNIVAAGSCRVVVKGVEQQIDRIEACAVEDGLRAFGPPRAWVLRLLRRREFRLLVRAPG